MLLGLALFAWLNDVLTKLKVSSVDNLQDTVVYLVIGAASLGLIFVGWFALEAVVLVPFKMWRRATEDAARARSDLDHYLEQPQLRLIYKDQAPWVERLPTTTTPLPDGTIVDPPAKFFRVEVSADESVTGCRVYLYRVEHLLADRDAWIESNYDGSQQLRWSKEKRASEFSGRDIHSSSRHYADVLSVDDYYNAVSPKFAGDFIANRDLFKESGLYRLTIKASAPRTADAEITLILEWTGHWNSTRLVPEREWTAREGAAIS